MILTNTDQTPEVMYFETLPKLTLKLIEQIEEFPRAKYGVVLDGQNLLLQFDKEAGHFFYDHEDTEAMGKQTDEHNEVLQGMKAEFEKQIKAVEEEREINKSEAVEENWEPNATRLVELEQNYMPKLAEMKKQFEQDCRDFIEGKWDIFIIRKRLEIYTAKGSLADLISDLISKTGL